jgi:hypothetical protein
VEVQLLIRHRADIAWLTFEDDGRFVFASGSEMTIEAIFRNIQLSADKPFRSRHRAFHHRLERLAPDKLLLRLPLPELFWAIDRLRIQPFVSRQTSKVRLALKLGRRPENPTFSGY